MSYIPFVRVEKTGEYTKRIDALKVSAGGDKSTQAKDIRLAIQLAGNFKE